MKRLFTVSAVSILVLLSGCASITGTTGQSVSVETRHQSNQLVGANCELSNAKGKWFVTSPGSVQIRRSNDDMVVLCTKEGFGPGMATIVSVTKGAMFGNIILGGAIGAVIDHTSGAAYEYPTLIQVMMGNFTKTENQPIALADQDPNIQANQPPNSLNANTMTLDLAKNECAALGFKAGTEPFGKCVLQLHK